MVHCGVVMSRVWQHVTEGLKRGQESVAADAKHEVNTRRLPDITCVVVWSCRLPCAGGGGSAWEGQGQEGSGHRVETKGEVGYTTASSTDDCSRDLHRALPWERSGLAFAVNKCEALGVLSSVFSILGTLAVQCVHIAYVCDMCCHCALSVCLYVVLSPIGQWRLGVQWCDWGSLGTPWHSLIQANQSFLELCSEISYSGSEAENNAIYFHVCTVCN